MKMTPIVFLAISVVAGLLPATLLAADYTAAFGAIKTAAYKQSGLEADVNQLTRQLGDYALKEIPYSHAIASGYAVYKLVQDRKLVFKIDGSKVLTLTPDFGSITLRF
jgi:hypothetical protein